MTDDDGIQYVRLFPELGQPTFVELITVVDGKLHRELVDPSLYPDVHALALAFGLQPQNYAAYLRNWFSGALEPVPYTAPLRTGLTVVAVSGPLYCDLPQLQQQLDALPQILPRRMVWPI